MSLYMFEWEITSRIGKADKILSGCYIISKLQRNKSLAMDKKVEVEEISNQNDTDLLFNSKRL